MLSRHGARYPTLHHGAIQLAERILNFTSKSDSKPAFSDELLFLNDWDYLLGNEILVPIGKQE